MAKRSATEASITRAIQKYLKSLDDVWFFKVHGGPFQTAGIPDILACRDGRLFGFEVKQQGKKATPIQQRTIDLINDAGGVALVVSSVEEVEATWS